MAADNGGITIPVSVIDNTQAGLQKAQNNILRALSSVPSEFRFTASLNSGDFSSAIAEITKGTYTAESRLKALTKAIQDNNKPLGKGQAKDMAKNILSNFDAYTKAAARLEQMSSKFKDFQKIAGDAINLKNVPDAKGGLGSIEKLIAEFNTLNSALNFKGENGKDLSANEIAKKLQLLQKLNENAAATMSMFGRFGKDLDAYKRGGATSQKLLESLGLSQEEYDKALSTLRSNEQKFTNQIAQILTQSGDTLAKKQAAWRKASKGEGSVANLFSELRNEATRLNTESNFNVAGFSAVDLLFTRLESIAKRRKALMQSFSKGDVTAIMRELNSYKRRANFALSTGDMDVIAAFNNNSAWGKSMQASKAVEQTLKANNEQLSVLKKREEITNQIVKTQQRLLELEKKGIDVASQLNNLNHARTLLTSSYAEGVSPQRAAFLANDSSSWLASVSKQTKEMEDAARKKEAADKALNGILQGVGGTNTRLGQFALKGIDVSDYSSRLQNISNGINNALNSSDLQQKTNAVNELRKALKELQNDITLGTSKSIIDSKTQAALNSVNQQLTSFKINKIGNFNNTLDRYERGGMDVSAYRKELNSLQNVLNAALNETDLERKRQLLTNLTNALDGLKTRAKGSFDKFTFDNRTAKNFDDATAAAKRYEAELDRVANAHKNNYSLVSQLGQEIAMVYSIQQVKQFLSSIVEIGGQFDQQRMAIGAILGDAHKANVIFEQVKQLGLHSNFTTLELDKYVKELSAFDIEYNQLFDKMKKLADISAGTGTDMSRIVLAYGHVKAAGYLEGMQRRQFTNANINIIAGLRDLYKKREGKDPGPRDIYKRISAKQVSYEDVDKVLMSLAEPGGKFYNMQETMANTTKGVWKNLGDAINHMYLALNTQFEGPIVAIGKTLTNFTKIVTRLTPYILSLGGAFATIKLMQAASTIAMGRHNATTLSAIRTENKRKISILETARSYRVLTEAEEAELAARKKGAMMWANSKGGDRVKNATLSGVRTGRVSYFETNRLVNSGAISEAEAKRANSQFVAMTANTNKLKVAYTALKFQSVGLWNSIAAGARIAGTAVKGFMAAMWPMLVLEGIIAGITWFNNKDKKDLEDQQKMIDANKSAIEGLTAALEQYNDVVVSSMKTDEIYDMEKDLLTALKDNLGDSRDILDSIYSKDENGHFLKSQIERTILLRNELEYVNKELQKIEGKEFNSSFDKLSKLGGREKTSGDSFKHDLESQVEYFGESYSKVSSAIAKYSKGDKNNLKKFLSGIAKSTPEFQVFVDENGKLNDRLEEQVRLAAELGKIREFQDKDIKNTDNGEVLKNSTAIREYASRIENIKKQFNKAIADKELPEDIKNLNKVQFRQVIFNWSLAKSNSKEAAEEIAEYLTHLRFGVPIHIKPQISVEDIEKDNAWRNELIDYLGGDDSPFKATIQAASDLDSARDACQQLYEKAYKTWENLKKTQNAFNIDVNFDITSGNLEEVRDRLKGEIAREQISQTTIFDEKELQASKARVKLLEDMLSSVETMVIATAKQKEGYFTDPNKNNKNKNTTKETDNELKDFKQKVTALGKLLQTYKKLKQEWGKTEALSTLTSSDTEEGKTFRDYFKDKNFSEKAILDMYEEFLKTAKKGGKDKEGWEAIANELASKLFDIKDETLKEKVDSIMQKMEDEFERRKGRINIYRSMLDATGNRDSSKQLAYFDGVQEDLDKINIWDSYSSAINDFNKEMQALKENYHTKNGEAFTYEMLLGMTPEELASEEIPEFVRNLYDKVNKEVENGRNEQMQQFASVFSEYQSEMERIAAETDKISRYEGVLNAGVNAGWIDQDQANAMIERMKAKLNLDTIENSLSYSAFTSFTIPKYIKEIDLLAQSIKNGLKRAFDSGAISAKKYMEEIQKIREIERKNKEASSKSKKFIDFFNGKSMNDRIEERNERGKAEEDIGFEKYNEAKDQLKETDWYKNMSKTDIGKSALDSMMKNADAGDFDMMKMFTNGTGAEMSANAMEMGKNMQAAGAGMQAGASSAASTMAIIDAIIHGINAIVQGVVETWKEIQQTKVALKGTTQLDDEGNIKNGRGKNRSFYNTRNSPDQNGFWNAFSQASQSATDGWDSFKNGDLLGVIKGVVGSWTKWFSGWAEAHDNREQAKIDEQERWLKQYERINTELELSLKRAFGTDLEDYTEQLKNYRAELSSVEIQRDSELEKKNSDSDAVQEYKARIAELEDTINNYAADIANTLYGIDFKGWAGQLTDALVEAFENGEDAALKWEQTVGDIVRDLGNKIMEKYLEEQVFNQLYEKYFGVDENGHATGLIGDISNMGTEDMKDITRQLHSDLSSKVGDVLGWFQDFYNQIDDYSPYSSSSETAGGLSKIGQNLTEETGGVIAGYINSLNGHVSAMRTIANKQMDAMNSIAQHTMRNAEAAERIDTALNQVMNGTKSIHIS